LTKFKRFLAAVLAAGLAFGVNIAVQPAFVSAAAPAPYVALGDSVPYGYGLTDPSAESYPVQFSSLLNGIGVPDILVNESVSGLTTGGLLTALQSLQAAGAQTVSAAALTAIQTADVITLDIGSNDVLGSMIALMSQTAASLNIDPNRLTPADIAQLIMAMQSVDFNQHPEFMLGVQTFTNDFPQIIAWLKMNAPNAKTIVSTLYNPFPQSIGTNIYNTSEQMLSAMNSVIFSAQMTGGVLNYAIADTYSAFKDAAGPVTNFSPQAGSIDIHPNAAGHALMAQIHLEASQAQFPAITSALLADGTVGAPYTAVIKADIAPVLFKLTTGSLPTGLSLDPLTGEITGTPTAAGSSAFGITALNGQWSSAEKSFTIAINSNGVVLPYNPGGYGTSPAQPPTNPQPALTPTPTVTPAPSLVIRLAIGDNVYTENGLSYTSDVAPYISDDGRTMVPIRLVAEALGAQVDWDAATRTAIISENGTTLRIVVDQPLPDNMGTAVIRGSRTFVPIRYISESLGATVNWDPDTMTVEIIQ